MHVIRVNDSDGEFFIFSWSGICESFARKYQQRDSATVYERSNRHLW